MDGDESTTMRMSVEDAKAKRLAMGLCRLLLQFYLAIALLLSGILHFQNPSVFFVSILKYRIVTTEKAQILAVTLPTLHLIFGLSILLKELYRETLIVASILFAIYVAVQLHALLAGFNISCGCFSPEAKNIGLFSIVIPFTLLIGCVASFVLDIGSKKCVNDLP